MMKKFLLFFVLCGCVATSNLVMPDSFDFVTVDAGGYEIATWQKITNPNNNNIHIYIEGDGNAFDAYGQITQDPTPRGFFMRDLAIHDDFDNVVYMARPCQFIQNENCVESDWGVGRFSEKIIKVQSESIKQIAKNKNIILIGYSGGAMVSGLVIKQNQDLKVKEWITIAGVLDHKKWTEFFGDEPLIESLNLDELPNVKQTHFVGEYDRTVPPKLAKDWANKDDIKIIPNATHDDFGDLKIFN